MPIEVICRSCGKAFTPTREDIAKGPHVWRYCPDCRHLPEQAA